MSNNLTASFPEIWAKKQQQVFLKKSVSEVVANVSYQSQLQSGNTFSRTKRNTNANDAPEVYIRGTDISMKDIVDTKEQLIVNKQFAIGFTIDNYDEIQSDYPTALSYGEDNGILLQTQIDADVLAEATLNAASVVDAADFGGTAGQGIAITAVNVLQTATAATKKLQKLNVYSSDKVAAVSPDYEEIISLYYGAKVTDLGDDVSQNGYFTKISGYKMYSTNNLTCSAVLAMATTPTDGDTVTIKGVVFTFKTTLGTTPGNVLIGGSADVARANLTALINAPATTTANGVKLGTQDILNFTARASATNDNTANTMTLVYKGAGSPSVSETLTDGTDTWTAVLQKQYLLFGIMKKCTTLITQKMPSIEVNKIPKQFGKYILNGVLYGVKSFTDDTKQAVRVEIRADTY